MSIIGGTREQREAQVLAQLYASWDAGILTPGTEEPGTGVVKSHEPPEVTKTAAALEYVPSHDGSRFISKIRLADAVKVGKEGYIHGFICVRPPCGKYSEATFNSKSGAIEHGGERIGRLRLNADKSFSVNHVAGGAKTKLDGQFADRKDAASSVALYHNIDAMHSAADPGAAKDHLAAARTALAAGDHDKAISELTSAHTAALGSDAALAEHINSTRASLASHPRPANALAGVAHEPEAVKPAEEAAKPAEVHAPAPSPAAVKPAVASSVGKRITAAEMRVGDHIEYKDQPGKVRVVASKAGQVVTFEDGGKAGFGVGGERAATLVHRQSEGGAPETTAKPAAAPEPAKLTPSTIAIDPKHDRDMQQHGVSAASRISMSSDPKAIAASMTDDELRAADNELARRAKLMGMEGKVGRGHQAVKDEIAGRGKKTAPAGGPVVNLSKYPSIKLTDWLSDPKTDSRLKDQIRDELSNRAASAASEGTAKPEATSADDVKNLPYHQKQAYDMRVANGMSHEKALAYAQFVPEPKASTAAPPPKMSAIEMGIRGGKVSTGKHGTSGPPMKSKVGSYQEAQQAEIRNAAPLSHKVGDPEGQNVSRLTGEVRYGSSPGIVGHLKKVPGGYQAVSAKTGEVTGVHAKRPDTLEELARFHNAATEAERAAKAGPEQVAGTEVAKPAESASEINPAAAEAVPPAGKKVNVQGLPAGYTVHDTGEVGHDIDAKKPLKKYELRHNGKPVATMDDFITREAVGVKGNVAYGGYKHHHRTGWRITDPEVRSNVEARKDHNYSLQARRTMLRNSPGLGSTTVGDAAIKAAEHHQQGLLSPAQYDRYSQVRHRLGGYTGPSSHEHALAEAQKVAPEQVPGSAVSGGPKA